MLNVKAAIETAKVLTLCTLASLTFMGILYTVPVQYIGMGITVVTLVMMIRLCYQTQKDRIETLERLNNIKSYRRIPLSQAALGPVRPTVWRKCRK